MPSIYGRTIPVGNPMKWTVSFQDMNGSRFDPDHGIKITITDPNGVITEYDYPAQLTKEDVGDYSVTVVSAISGDYVGTGRGLLVDGTPVTTEPTAQRVG